MPDFGTTLWSTRSQKSNRSLNGPPPWRTRVISWSRPAAEALDRRQPEDDLARLHREIGLAFVDVGGGGQHFRSRVGGRRSMCSTMMVVRFVAVVDLARGGATP